MNGPSQVALAQIYILTSAVLLVMAQDGLKLLDNQNLVQTEWICQNEKCKIDKKKPNIFQEKRCMVFPILSHKRLLSLKAI